MRPEMVLLLKQTKAWPKKIAQFIKKCAFICFSIFFKTAKTGFTVCHKITFWISAKYVLMSHMKGTIFCLIKYFSFMWNFLSFWYFKKEANRARKLLYLPYFFHFSKTTTWHPYAALRNKARVLVVKVS